jgi:tetratricopeptide (TPR) repeat protein
MTSTGTTSTGIDALQQLAAGDASSDALLSALEEIIRQRKDFHRLFDAKLIRVRQQMGLPLTQPTSLETVPADKEAEFRQAYIDAAREVGQLFLDEGQLSDAWAYFRTIGEPEPVRQAIEKIAIPREPNEELDEVLNVALYEGAHIARGLEILLKTHGTCNTVTAFSQVQQQMSLEERRTAAAMMVRNIYDDLRSTLKRDVESRHPVLDPNASIRDLIRGRDWLFTDGNYHIDVSHLHSTVGFARALHREDPELQQAIELCEYGAMLSGPLQYPGDVPFDEYYKAHRHFLGALAGENVDEALAYFQKRLEDEPDAPDQQLIAFVLLDLAQRVGRTDSVLEKAAPFVGRMEDPNGFSFSSLCVELGRVDVLEKTATDNDDVIGYVTAKLLSEA